MKHTETINNEKSEILNDFVHKYNLYLKQIIQNLYQQINTLLNENYNLKKTNSYLTKDYNLLLNNINTNKLNKLIDKNNIITNNIKKNNHSILTTKTKDTIILNLEKQLQILEKRVFNQQLIIDHLRSNLPKNFKEKKPCELRGIYKN